jgi:hypothetical protein
MTLSKSPFFCFIFLFIVEVNLNYDSLIQIECITEITLAWYAHFFIYLFVCYLHNLMPLIEYAQIEET